jgi:hypothetical protein
MPPGPAGVVPGLINTAMEHLEFLEWMLRPYPIASYTDRVYGGKQIEILWCALEAIGEGSEVLKDIKEGMLKSKYIDLKGNFSRAMYQILEGQHAADKGHKHIAQENLLKAIEDAKT